MLAKKLIFSTAVIQQVVLCLKKMVSIFSLNKDILTKSFLLLLLQLSIARGLNFGNKIYTEVLHTLPFLPFFFFLNSGKYNGQEKEQPAWENKRALGRESHMAEKQEKWPETLQTTAAPPQHLCWNFQRRKYIHTICIFPCVCVVCICT